LIRLAVRVARERSELVLAELLELAPGGVEEVDVDQDIVEYAVYGAPGELPSMPDVRAAAGGALVEVTSSEIADDWADRWREFHQPLVLGERLTVRAPWHESGFTRLDVVIDPGRAFGTGAHATTRLCLELMLDLRARGSFLDLGCGSGVLAIVAAKLGWEPVRGVDNDPAAIEATRENALANGVEVNVTRLDLRRDPFPESDTVAANLLGPLLVRWADRMTVVPTRVVASGMLVAEANHVAAALGAHGLVERRRLAQGEWAGLLLERVSS
jgi:ribosomal protein L11 methyltransferase